MTQPLTLIGHVPLPAHTGSGGFDHAAVRAATGHVYVAHTANSTVDVFDPATQKHLYSIPGLTAVAGALVSDEDQLVFTSNRGEDTIGVFAPGPNPDVTKIAVGVRPNGLAYDGAWAEYTVARAVGLTLVPDNVPLEQAAILADAVSTPYGAVVRTGNVGIGESVGVWGVGGVGTHIVQLARLVGAVPVIAVDIKPAVLDRALELGADHAFDSRDEQLKDKIADVTGGRKLDVAFDAVGLKSTFEQALDCVRVGGRLVAVGMSDQSPTVGPTAMFGLTHKQVLGHLGYQNVDIETLVTLVSRGRLDVSRSISDIVSLEDVTAGIEQLEDPDGNAIRILVKP